MRIKSRPLLNCLLTLFIWVACCLPLVTVAAGAPLTPPQTYVGSESSRYDFTFYYNGPSGDTYSGYLYAPTGFLSVGSRLDKQPQEMGGGQLAGYYYITGETAGYDPSYDGKYYVTSYYDGDTGKTSYTFSNTLGEKTAANFLYIADRRHTDEEGYVYDPSIPVDDPYFGNPDVCYYFSPLDNHNSNFLASYISDLPYWDQPYAYPGSCSEVAAAIDLSYWDNQGYANLISTDWQNNWPDNTSNNPNSYVNFISTLASSMSWTGNGTYVSDIGPGLLGYAASMGYPTSFTSNSQPGFTFEYHDVLDYRAWEWNDYTRALNAGHPVIVDIAWSAGGHSTVGRGYWNDGHVLLDFGWGTDYTNQKIDWFQPYAGYSYDRAFITDFIDLYYNNTYQAGRTYINSYQ